jgi:hypothetical protein
LCLYQNVGDRAQTVIARRMTIDVVEALEAVHVDQQQCQACFIAHCPAPLRFDRCIEGAAIGNAGQRIDPCQAL